MRIVLSTPSRNVQRTGNRCTARQWADLFEELGHDVRIVEIGSGDEQVDSDFLIALHGGRSHAVIRNFRKTHPGGKLIVAMTGTDIYPEPDEQVRESISLADRIVVLQDKAIKQIPESYRPGVRVIFQAAKPYSGTVDQSTETFDICVVGHLREVKDPLRSAAASRLLPKSSMVRVRHIGGILDSKHGELVEREMEENPRYRWLGELDEVDVAREIAASSLMVLSSFSEGGARVVGEAVVNGTPVISSSIDGVLGLLGDDYPGYFPPGDTEALAVLLEQAETDPEFLQALRSGINNAAPRFHPDREKEAWRKLIEQVYTSV